MDFERGSYTSSGEIWETTRKIYHKLPKYTNGERDVMINPKMKMKL